ncbi:MAG TPA: hypothetical protein VIJ31_16760 [Acidothermaceae bacterium]
MTSTLSLTIDFTNTTRCTSRTALVPHAFPDFDLYWGAACGLPALQLVALQIGPAGEPAAAADRNAVAGTSEQSVVNNPRIAPVDVIGDLFMETPHELEVPAENSVADRPETKERPQTFTVMDS